ncbi:MAG: hypothetical protein Nk1A_3440 [Endomicrobiia bacterium]|nr:MAG: hypothetical protein Nk1A_3440 [Endomicrobiia bacterium]
MIKIKTQIDEKRVYIEKKRNEMKNIVDEVDRHKKEMSIK